MLRQMKRELEEYRQLVSLSQLYILQESTTSKWISASSGNWHFFRSQALAAAKEPTPIPPQPSPPIPPPEPSPPLPTALPKDFIKSEKKMKESIKEPPTAMQEEPPTVNPREIKLTPPGIPEKESFDDLKTLYQHKFPTQALLDMPPSDEVAKEKQQTWKKNPQTPDVIFLTFSDSQLHLSFLQNVAKAISLHFGLADILNAKKIEAMKEWDTCLKSNQPNLIIACEKEIKTAYNLMLYYQENEGRYYLNSIPLLLIDEIPLFFTEPQRKVSLWKTLCEYLSK